MGELGRKMLEADGILFGSPVYFYNITAQGKAVIDRTIALGHDGRALANKVGGVIVVGGSLGLVDAVKDLFRKTSSPPTSGTARTRDKCRSTMRDAKSRIRLNLAFRIPELRSI